MRIAYCRVSTASQNLQRQEEALEQYGIDKWFKEKVSAKDTNRPKLQEMLDFVREGDTVYIHDFSRIARSTGDLLQIISFLNDKKVCLVSNKENIDTSTATGLLLVTVIAAINSFERSVLLERQREGIEIAKREKRYRGSKPKTVANFGTHYDRYITRQISKSALAKELKISRPTLNKLIVEHEAEMRSAR